MCVFVCIVYKVNISSPVQFLLAYDVMTNQILELTFWLLVLYFSSSSHI